MLICHQYASGRRMPSIRREESAAVCSHNEGHRATCMLLNGVLWACCTATLLMSIDAIAMLATLQIKQTEGMLIAVGASCKRAATFPILLAKALAGF